MVTTYLGINFLPDFYHNFSNTMKCIKREEVFQVFTYARLKHMDKRGFSMCPEGSIGDGSSTSFLNNAWLSCGVLSSVFPRLLWLMFGLLPLELGT